MKTTGYNKILWMLNIAMGVQSKDARVEAGCNDTNSGMALLKRSS